MFYVQIFTSYREQNKNVILTLKIYQILYLRKCFYYKNILYNVI